MYRPHAEGRPPAWTARLLALILVAAALVLPARAASAARVPEGGVLRISVPEAYGGKTVIGQVAVDDVIGSGFVTAFGCSDGLPTAPDGQVTRADLNFDGRVSPIWSNRLIVQADGAGDICLFTSRPAALVVDVSGVSFDTGISSFPNRRTDTRAGSQPLVAPGATVRIAVPEAIGGKTVVGQLAVDRVAGAGFVTAYGCDAGPSLGATGEVTRADLNFDGRVSPVWSNRLVVQADADGEVCVTTSNWAAVVVDVNAVSEHGIVSFANRRSDTRAAAVPLVPAGGVERINVPEALGRGTVVGQVAVDRASGGGFVTAYGCDDGLPAAGGQVTRADLNFDGRVAPVWSNRLVVQADADGDVCLYTSSRAALVVDVNGASAVGIYSFPNRRTDTRSASGSSAGGATVTVDGIPVWPPYAVRPQVDGVAALTGLPADAVTTARPILAVKIDNFVRARPQWGLDQADAVIEVNAEGITRFIAMFHSRLPAVLGPVRSSRTGDLDLLAGMNRPVFAYSGANPGVTDWIASAASSGVLADHSAQHSPCYSRSPDRAGPHNLLIDPACTLAARAGGPARPLWSIDAGWRASGDAASAPDGTVIVPMDGVTISWSWDAATGRYLRHQDGQPHVAVDGVHIAADSVIVLTTTYVPSPVDARSPNPITVGSGNGVVHRDGVSIPVTWSRATPYSAFEFRTATTDVLVPLDTGTTFVQLTR